MKTLKQNDPKNTTANTNTNTSKVEELQGHGWENCANTVADELFISGAAGGRAPTPLCPNFCPWKIADIQIQMQIQNSGDYRILES